MDTEISNDIKSNEIELNSSPVVEVANEINNNTSVTKVTEEKKKICKKCNSEIKTNRKVFCSTKCAKAFHALKQYHKIKSTDDYKNKRRLYKIKVKRDKIILKVPQPTPLQLNPNSIEQKEV